MSPRTPAHSQSHQHHHSSCLQNLQAEGQVPMATGCCWTSFVVDRRISCEARGEDLNTAYTSQPQPRLEVPCQQVSLADQGGWLGLGRVLVPCCLPRSKKVSVNWRHPFPGEGASNFLARGGRIWLRCCSAPYTVRGDEGRARVSHA